MRVLFLLLVAAMLAGCTNPVNWVKPYRIEIQQGNFVTQEMVAQLKPGMTREQVRFALGTPLVTDIFHADRWDYVFRRQRENSTHLEERRLTVFFEGDKLARVEGDVVPAEASPAARNP
jgi:outer membrane protein assembly factor BamE